MTRDKDFAPPRPKDPYFDSKRVAWILSRFADVSAAMKERALHLASPKGKTFPDGEDEAKRSRQFAQLRAELTLMSAAKWRAEAEDLADRIISEAMCKPRVDLLSDIVQPWCVAVLVALSGATPPDAIRIAKLVECLYFKPSSGTNTPGGTRLKLLRDRGLLLRYEEADKQVDHLLAWKELALSRQMFMALSQTLPSFLVKSWIALLRHPAEVLRLRADPALMPNAYDELVRYAGIVHTLFRKADQDVDLAGIRIAQGQLVALKVASANFDPERFPDPYRLDVARRPAGQLGLGLGLHVCMGAVLVRQAFTLLTPRFLAAGPVLDRRLQILWFSDRMLRRPFGAFVNSGALSRPLAAQA